MSGDEQKSRSRALRLAIEAGRRLGLDVTGAAVFRVRSSVHVDLPEADAVARVEEPGAEEAACQQVSFARLLAEKEAPVARLVRPEGQPVLFEDGAVTLWRRVRSVGSPTLAAVGRAVRAVHDATRGSLAPELPRIDPLGTALADSGWPSPWSGTGELAELRRRIEELEVAWPAALQEAALGTSVVHGDVHQANALLGEKGVVLIDLEDTAVGPASWDFVPLTVATRRYGLPAAEYEAFVAGYGAEPGPSAGFEAMCEAYELMTTLWAIRSAAGSAEMAAEATVRVQGVLGRGAETWTQR